MYERVERREKKLEKFTRVCRKGKYEREEKKTQIKFS